ncbi:DUF5818 domain-containing protein [Actinoplanes sp. NPDC051633]|uniref:DUF5818 domain-containing protein n=1 Tax=Actinoplanes sp. NPDC051633 TaxID=3155670 RepID=UPI003433B750
MLTVLATGAVLVPLAACGSENDRGPAAAGPSSAASPPVASPPRASPPTASSPTGGSAAATPRSSATTAGGRAATTRPTRPPPTTAAPPGSGELPGELPHGNRKLTGVVERSGDCAMLRVGDRLWGLTGSRVQPLRPGDRVTVQGQVTTASGGCAEAGAAQSVVVRSVTKA